MHSQNDAYFGVPRRPQLPATWLQVMNTANETVRRRLEDAATPIADPEKMRRRAEKMAAFPSQLPEDNIDRRAAHHSPDERGYEPDDVRAAVLASHARSLKKSPRHSPNPQRRAVEQPVVGLRPSASSHTPGGFVPRGFATPAVGPTEVPPQYGATGGFVPREIQPLRPRPNALGGGASDPPPHFRGVLH